MPWQFGEMGRVPCQETNPEAWFPQRPAQLSQDEITAIKICGSCMFREECLKYALHNDVSGIWGGLTDQQRSHLRNRLGIKAKPMSHLMWDKKKKEEEPV
jgi:hypothetical protein